jgi:hypothetical protein
VSFRVVTFQVHQDLPALHLTETVRRRTELRLQALVGATVSGDAVRLGKEVPCVLRAEPRDSLATAEEPAQSEQGVSADAREAGKGSKKKRRFGAVVPARLERVVWDK